jgi:hypothetical protein
LNYEELMEELGESIKKWLDMKSTGVLFVEIHTFKGGIADAYTTTKQTFQIINKEKNGLKNNKS